MFLLNRSNFYFSFSWNILVTYLRARTVRLSFDNLFCAPYLDEILSNLTVSSRGFVFVVQCELVIWIQFLMRRLDVAFHWSCVLCSERSPHSDRSGARFPQALGFEPTSKSTRGWHIGQDGLYHEVRILNTVLFTVLYSTAAFLHFTASPLIFVFFYCTLAVSWLH